MSKSQTNITGSWNRLLTAAFIVLIAILSWQIQGLQAEESKAGKVVETAHADLADPFSTMMAVITHKRCVNCHPSGNRPRQGEDSHLHFFNVRRGPDGHGTAALTCNSCHQETNNPYSGVPGAPHWHLAPRSMGWEGLSRTEVAEAMLDPARNGGRSLEEIVKHLTEDPLVLWAFTPGVDADGNTREMPPVSKQDYIRAVKDWMAAGATIPDQ